MSTMAQMRHESTVEDKARRLEAILELIRKHRAETAGKPSSTQSQVKNLFPVGCYVFKLKARAVGSNKLVYRWVGPFKILACGGVSCQLADPNKATRAESAKGAEWVIDSRPGL